jgi:hypothetical protein
MSPVTGNQNITTKTHGRDKDWAILFGDRQRSFDRLGDGLGGGEVHPPKESIQYLNRLRGFRQQVAPRLFDHVPICPAFVPGIDQVCEQLADCPVRLRGGEKNIGVKKDTHPPVTLLSGLHLFPRTQDFCEIGLCLVELANSRIAVHFNRQCDSWPQQKTVWGGLGNELVVRLNTERFAKLRRQSDNTAAANGQSDFHRYSMTVLRQICKSGSSHQPSGDLAAGLGLTPRRSRSCLEKVATRVDGV